MTDWYTLDPKLTPPCNLSETSPKPNISRSGIQRLKTILIKKKKEIKKKKY